ncbi:hypothetical protein H6F88_19700 [Oculatella sp. FACHB-28]|uniref:hypothetical protein n=1 Tax=Oculatella sp. FACHB-28 TaxID=2692845 RepID=UPI00168719C7|nr:hypothetical protein [Oculatella sp. FACHB-28]MBD2058198.1 hypothetical protein [Oculatella sp. FACHB-28]
MTAQLIKPILTLLAVQSDDSSSGVTLWNAPVKLIKAILSKQPEISEAMKAKGQPVDWTETPAVRTASGAIASTKDAAGELSQKVAHWLATVATSAQENIGQLTAGSTQPLQNAASQVKQAIAQTTHSATDFLQSTQSSVQATIQGTIDSATTSTTSFFQTAAHTLQDSTAELGTEAATGLGDSVETATSFTLEKVGQALSGASWLVVKSYLWVSSKVSTGAQQAILETTGAETITPDPTPIVTAAPEVGSWVIFAEVCGVLVFYAALGWYAFWVWQNLPYRPGKRLVGKPDFDPSRWIWWSQASPEAGLDQPHPEQPSHPEQRWNWHNLPYAEVLKGLISRTGTSERSNDQ